MIFSKKVESIYQSQVLSRFDDHGTIFYFSEKDFPGLKKESFCFNGSDGQRLQGYFYFYDSVKEDKLIIFDHGMGGGHRSYFREIEMLCKKGYLVFSYDHTGCMESGGESPRGFSQSLNDLVQCMTALKESGKLENKTVDVMGHSWGAFAAMNIPKYFPEINHVVAMSGFICPYDMIKQVTCNIKGLYSRFFAIEEENNPEYCRVNVIDSLKDTKTKVLIIQSDDDKTVKIKNHFNKMKEGLKGNKNVTFMAVSGKNHNPNYTLEAVGLMEDFFKELSAKIKKKAFTTAKDKESFKNSFDWWKITEQDEEVWEKIYSHLES